jgi:hypothetical protein
MSVIQWPTHNGKVVSNISLTHPSPVQGAKPEYSVMIKFNDGSELYLKSESTIKIEERN